MNHEAQPPSTHPPAGPPHHAPTKPTFSAPHSPPRAEVADNVADLLRIEALDSPARGGFAAANPAASSTIRNEVDLASPEQSPDPACAATPGRVSFAAIPTDGTIAASHPVANGFATSAGSRGGGSVATGPCPTSPPVTTTARPSAATSRARCR